MYTVYKHTAPNGKVYIGITGQKPEQRWKNGNGYKNNPHFYSAIRKYTWKNFKHEIVENGLTKQQACDLEIELIAEYHATDPRKGYNISTGGDCSGAGVHPSAESLRKRNESIKRAYLNPELRKKMSEANKGANNPNYGKHLGLDTRRKISEAKKGKPSPWKGKHPSPEARKKMSEAHKCANNPNYGKHLSVETRLKISEAHKGTHYSPEARRKLSESHKGICPSYETRRKMSESHKGKTAKAVICVETGTLYASCTEAAQSIGVAKSGITKVLHGVHNTAGGYHWKYAD